MSEVPKQSHPSESNPPMIPAQDGVMTAISRAELDAQITTARAYPRSVRRFLDDALSIATLNEHVADECYYALPSRKGDGDDKPIEGPSIRLAEILLSSWGNCRAGTRVIEEGAEFVVAQGVFRDLERNTEVSKEVRRRITTKTGRRYSADMIGVTANAACSIALRNAICAGIPRALWDGIYEQARRASVGSEKTLAAKRTAMIEFFVKSGVSEAAICATLGVRGIEDIDLSKLATLKGIVNAIRDGETTKEEAFRDPAKAADGAAASTGKGVAGLSSRMAAATPAGTTTATTTSQPVSVASTSASPPVEAKPTEARKAEIDESMRKADVAEDNPKKTVVAEATGTKFPLVPVDDSTAFWIADIEDVQNRKPLLGTVLYLGASFGFQQWDGTSWRTIPDEDLEPVYDRCILAMRKRLTKRWKDENKDRGAAMVWVRQALDLQDVPVSLTPFTLDQLVKLLGLMGAEPKP